MGDEGANRRPGAPFLIGLTGNIASGKSTVMRLARARGAETIDADRVVHALLGGDGALQADVVAAFGPDVRQSDGAIDRVALGRLVFGDAVALRRLEKMVHPRVRLELNHRLETTAAAVVMIEAIKLLESGLADECDQVWVTYCPAPVQMERLRVCRGLTQAEAAVRLQAQGSPAEKLARADVVIDTDGSMAVTRRQFEAAWQEVLVYAGRHERMRSIDEDGVPASARKGE